MTAPRENETGRRRGPGLVVALVAAVAVVSVGVSIALARGGAGDPDSSRFDDDYSPQQMNADVEAEVWDATAAGEAFVATYVQDDGRVVRPDHGGDTVSEGQAYGLLIAVGLGDAETFDRVWSWTRDNLQREDGLLAWRWADGGVVDDQPASDADLDAARALALAAEAFDEPRYAEAATALGEAVLELETAQTDLGRVLTAGAWTTGSPWAINPSYATPVATALLDDLAPDERWAEVDAGARAANLALVGEGTLPPDWAQIHADGRVEPMPGAMGNGEDVRYSYDATRTFVRFAESCTSVDHEVAAAPAGSLEQSEVLAAALDLGGGALTEDEHPVAYAARAAARAVTGDTEGALADLAAADALQQRAPSYFGGAWAALGRMMLQTDVLGGCPLLPQDGPEAGATGSGATGSGATTSAPGAGTPSGFTSVVGERPAQRPDDAPTGPQALADEGVVPVRVSIEAIGVDSALEDLVTEGGVLQPPVVPESAGWFTEGTVPGDRGPAVIAGHVDSGVAGAVFRDLDQLEPGDVVEVEMSDGTLQTFRVDRSSVVSQAQAQFPTSQVYGPVPDRQLRLITCHTYDPDRSAYIDNLVVFATAES